MLNRQDANRRQDQKAFFFSNHLGVCWRLGGSSDRRSPRAAELSSGVRMTEPMPNFRRWKVRTHVKVWGLVAASVLIPLAAYQLMLRMPGKSYKGPLPPLSSAEVSL